MIFLICSRIRIGVVSEDVASPRSGVATILLRHVLPGSLVSSEPLGDGGSDVRELGALASVKKLSNRSPSDETSRFSARGSMSFSLLVSALSVC